MRDELDFSYEEARDTLSHLKALLDHEGWKVFMEVLTVRVQAINQQLLNGKITSTKEMIDYNRLQSSAQELTVVPQILQQMIIDLETQIKKYQEDIEEEDDDVQE